MPISLGKRAFFINIDKVKELKKEIFIISLTDITSLQQVSIEAQHKASHDDLTEVYNKAKFNELYEIEFLRAKRYKRTFCLAILDIDLFKKVNDTYGHLVGDEILKNLANTCKNSIRKTDFFARWGGEEFVLLMSETIQEEAKEVCENLRKKIENIQNAKLPQITISIGVACFMKNDTKETLFKRVDEALYKAKQQGRNQVYPS